MGKDQYTITLDAERGLVHVVAHGELFRAVGEEIISKATTMAAEHNYKILCDVRQALAKVSLADWFYMPRTLAVFKDIKTRTIKTAVLITPATQEEDYKFYESVTHNLGMNLRIFFSEKNALEWLSAVK